MPNPIEWILANPLAISRIALFLIMAIGIYQILKSFDDQDDGYDDDDDDGGSGILVSLGLTDVVSAPLSKWQVSRRKAQGWKRPPSFLFGRTESKSFRTTQFERRSRYLSVATKRHLSPCQKGR